MKLFEDNKVRGLRITELAERLGVTVRALRYYEDAGLLAPDRTSGNVRVYGPDARCLAERVFALRAAGLGAAEIRYLLKSCVGGREALLAQMLRDKLADLDFKRGLILQEIDKLGGVDETPHPEADGRDEDEAEVVIGDVVISDGSSAPVVQL